MDLLELIDSLIEEYDSDVSHLLNINDKLGAHMELCNIIDAFNMRRDEVLVYHHGYALLQLGANILDQINSGKGVSDELCRRYKAPMLQLRLSVKSGNVYKNAV